MKEIRNGNFKEYHLKSQEKENYCVPSVLQSIFNKYGMGISQDIIANELTPSEHGFKVNDNKMKDFIGFMGFNFEHYFHNTAPLNEPELLFDDFDKKDIFIGYNNHLGLVTGYDYPHISFRDPKDASLHLMMFETLLKRMRNSKDGGDFGLLKKLG
jgi:hypothetical protein